MNASKPTYEELEAQLAFYKDGYGKMFTLILKDISGDLNMAIEQQRDMITKLDKANEKMDAELEGAS